MQQAKIALVFNGVWSHYAFAKAEKYKQLIELVYVHDLATTDLNTYEALMIPFQSDHKTIADSSKKIAEFLGSGKKVFVEGDSSAGWLDATWEDRPVNNYWWVEHPQQPPVSKTNFEHPVYHGLTPRHACWHTHGAYTKVPDHAEVLQVNGEQEVITWETGYYGGKLLVTTLDPIVEHGVQQITHLDHYVDQLIEWLIGIKPEGAFVIDSHDYGVSWT